MDLSHLNDKQREAVLYNGNRLAVIAGAGAGKTTVFTERIAYLINECDVPPQYITATAFTNKSAEEIVERLQKKIGRMNALKVRMGTFHSISNSLYKDVMRKKRAGFRMPKLVNRLEAWNLVRNLAKDYDFINKDVKRILNQISLWKNSCLTPEMIQQKLEVENKLVLKNVKPSSMKVVADLFAYQEYQKYLKKHGKMDFDDMLLNLALLLKNPDYADEVQDLRRRMSHILVDESQDTNLVQFSILQSLIGDISEQKNVMIVGDDWQAIYGFRGSDVDHFKRFLEMYKFDYIRLEQNYRSTKKIVKYGNALIKHNDNQIDKTLHTENMEGDKADVFVSIDEEDEADKVLDKIEELICDGFSFSDIAIIYRVNAQSRAIVDKFVTHDIPHKVYAKYSFYERKEIKDILAYLKIFHNPYEATHEDFGRIINKPSRYLGQAVITKIRDLMRYDGYDNFYEALCHYHKASGLRNFQYGALRTFVDDIEMYHKAVHDKGLETQRVINMILYDVGYEKYLVKEGDSDNEGDDDKMMNLDALFEGAERYPSIDKYFGFLETMKEDHESETDYVHCMTVHKAKGLEFPVVFVIGMGDKIFPHSKSTQEGKLEDERRIAYVAVTRAQEYLYLGVIDGKFGRYKMYPSPFIQEMGIQLGGRRQTKEENRDEASIDRRKQPIVQRLPYIPPKN
jgi:DNA helicase-2/ATP-dependent DNA helicase PcrA